MLVFIKQKRIMLRENVMLVTKEVREEENLKNVRILNYMLMIDVFAVIVFISVKYIICFTPYLFLVKVKKGKVIKG